MFTGIIEEIGKIEKTTSIPGGLNININAGKILEDIRVNDSICVDGVCLTVTKISNNSFWIDAVGATLEKSTFNHIHQNDLVNLERSVKLNDRLGGHLVQGHVNGVGKISDLKKLGENYLLKIIVPENLVKYIIREGSIAINGISLTISNLESNEISISIIPHTWVNTNLKTKRVNDLVNIEVDILAKYVEKLLSNVNGSEVTNISENWLKELGY